MDGRRDNLKVHQEKNHKTRYTQTIYDGVDTSPCQNFGNCKSEMIPRQYGHSVFMSKNFANLQKQETQDCFYRKYSC